MAIQYYILFIMIIIVNTTLFATALFVLCCGIGNVVLCKNKEKL